MIRYVHIPFALGVVLVGSADFDLTARDANGVVVEHVCAKSVETCEMAISAIRRGWLASELRPLTLHCAPHADCFDERSDFIPSYNMPARLR